MYVSDCEKACFEVLDQIMFRIGLILCRLTRYYPTFADVHFSYPSSLE